MVPASNATQQGQQGAAQGPQVVIQTEKAEDPGVDFQGVLESKYREAFRDPFHSAPISDIRWIGSNPIKMPNSGVRHVPIWKKPGGTHALNYSSKLFKDSHESSHHRSGDGKQPTEGFSGDTLPVSMMKQTEIQPFKPFEEIKSSIDVIVHVDGTKTTQQLPAETKLQEIKYNFVHGRVIVIAF
jgi:hypothetical protein